MSNQTFTIEEVQNYFFKDSSLKQQPETLYRLDSKGNRYYYRFDQSNNPKFYISATSLTSSVLPTSDHLIDWMCANGGREASKIIMHQRADYGTTMHLCIEQLIKTGKIDLDDDELGVSDIDRNYYVAIKADPSTSINSLDPSDKKELKKDILSFHKFYTDYKVRPLAIECTLASDKYGIAGTMDLLAYVTIPIEGDYGEVYKSGPRKGETKLTKKMTEVLSVIDFKSGRKGFYLSHEIQLLIYKILAEENFNITVDKLYNWSPSDWRESENPTFSYKGSDQTGKHDEKLVFHMKGVFDCLNSEPVYTKTNIGGTVELNKPASNNYTFTNMNSELVEFARQINRPNSEHRVKQKMES